MCVYVGVGKIACTLFVFAATTAVLPMNREMRGISASVQVKVCTNLVLRHFWW